MAKRKFTNGEKAIIDCLTDQLQLIQVTELLPGDEVYIVRKSFTDKDRDFYIVNKEAFKTTGQTLPENYLKKL